MRDDAQQVHYFNNTEIVPTEKCEHDSMYRLLKAEGLGFSSLNPHDSGDFTNNIPVPNPSANAMQNDTQLFVCEQLGNIKTMSSPNQSTRIKIFNYTELFNNIIINKYV
jgi:hypothetical protein